MYFLIAFIFEMSASRFSFEMFVDIGMFLHGFLVFHEPYEKQFCSSNMPVYVRIIDYNGEKVNVFYLLTIVEKHQVCFYKSKCSANGIFDEHL